jgi:hypothetical protein
MIEVIQSPLLREAGFAHGFSLRTGGVSRRPFDSANLGRAIGDDPEDVAENHRRLAPRIGYSVDALYESSQVHGAGVVDPISDRTVLDVRATQADALIARRAGDAVGVRTADCVPVLIGDVRSGAAAAIHAGWRGVVAGVTRAAVQGLTSRGSRATDLVVALGPHIRAERFEVGMDVAEQIRGSAFGAEVVVGESAAGKPLVDLTRALRAQLHALGIERVDDVGGCTLAEPERFFSYRRDGAASGRHLAVIVAR